MTYYVDLKNHFKIWFSANPSYALPVINQLRLIRTRVNNPSINLSIVYSSMLLNQEAEIEFLAFCRTHQFIPIDFDTQLPARLTHENDFTLYQLAQQQLVAFKNKKGGNLAAASDLVRWISYLLLQVGHYTDLDVNLNLGHPADLETPTFVRAPIVMNLGSTVSKLRSGEQEEALRLNNDVLLLAKVENILNVDHLMTPFALLKTIQSHLILMNTNIRESLVIKKYMYTLSRLDKLNYIPSRIESVVNLREWIESPSQASVLHNAVEYSKMIVKYDEACHEKYKKMKEFENYFDKTDEQIFSSVLWRCFLIKYLAYHHMSYEDEKLYNIKFKTFFVEGKLDVNVPSLSDWLDEAIPKGLTDLRDNILFDLVINFTGPCAVRVGLLAHYGVENTDRIKKRILYHDASLSENNLHEKIVSPTALMFGLNYKTFNENSGGDLSWTSEGSKSLADLSRKMNQAASVIQRRYRHARA